MASKVWKLNGRRGIAYVEGKEKAEQVMALCGTDTTKKLPEVAMAEYRDKRGRAFAWQLLFDLGRWDAVSAAIGEQQAI